MRPRLRSRGVRVVRGERGREVLVASMRPRLRSRGVSHHCNSPVVKDLRVLLRAVAPTRRWPSGTMIPRFTYPLV